MPSLTQDFNKEIDKRTTALLTDNNLTQNQRDRLNAEIIVIKNLINDNRRSIEAGNRTMIGLLTEVQNGFRTGTRRERVERYAQNIRNFTEKVGLKDYKIFPVDYENYVKNGFNLEGEQLVQFRQQLSEHYNETGLDIYNVRNFQPFQGQVQLIKREIGLNNTGLENETALTEYFGNDPLKSECDEAARNTELLTGRPFTHRNTFRMYLIAKKNLSFEEAVNVVPGSEHFEEYVQEFKTFWQTHPTSNANVDLDQRISNAREWLNLFNTFAEKMKDYRIPDFDYDNPQEMAAHSKELYALSGLITDYGQQVEPFVKYNTDVLVHIENGKEDALKHADEIDSLATFCKNYQKAYIGPADENGAWNRPEVVMNEAAANRICFHKLANKFHGKTIDEINRDDTAEKLYRQEAFIGSGNLLPLEVNVTKEQIKNYLVNNDENVKNMLNEGMDRVVENCRRKNNTELYAHIGTEFFAKIKEINETDVNRALLDTIFSEGRTAQDISELVRAEESESVRLLIDEAFSTIFVNNGQATRLQLANIDRPLDMIHVDGKSVDDVWGEKYGDIPAGRDKDLIYKFELVNAILKGQSRITMDQYVVNSDLNLVKEKEVEIIPSLGSFNMKKDFLGGIDTVHSLATNAVEMWQTPEFEVIAAANPELNKVRESIQVLARTAADVNSNFKQLNSAFNTFKNDAVAFYQKHEQLMKDNNASFDQMEKFRKHQADALTSIAEQMDKLNRIDAQMNLSPGENEDETDYQFTFRGIKQKLEDAAKIRGWGENAAELTGETVLDSKFDFIEGQTYEKQINDLDMETLKDSASLYVVPETVFSPGQAANVNANGIGNNTLLMVWAMGVKGMSFDEAVKLQNDDPNAIVRRNKTVQHYKNQFESFCQKYPYTHQDTANSAKTSVEKWTKAYAGFLEKAGTVTLPDIDYADPAQVAANKEKLSALVGLGQGVAKEFPRLYSEAHPDINADNVGIKATNPDSFWKLKTEINRFKEITQLSAGNGYVINENNPDNTRVDQLAGQAIGRSYTGRQMAKFRGKTIREAIEQNPGELLYKGTLGQELMKQVESPEVKNGIPAEHALKSLVGANKVSFDREVNSKEIEIEGRVRFESLEKRQLHAAKQMPGLFSSETEAQLLAKKEITDEFLNRPFIGNKTGRDYIADKIGKCCDNVSRGILRGMNVRESDTFLINGQKPSDLWGEKYKNIANPEEREVYYQAEIIKAIASGNAEIKRRVFGISQTNAIEEKEPVTALIEKEKLQKMVLSNRNYEAEKSNLLTYLKEVRMLLIQTQDDKMAIFYDRDKTAGTGSTSYQNFAVQVRNAIDVLEGNSKAEEIINSLDSLRQASDAYHSSHSASWRGGPKTFDGKVRLSLAGVCKNNISQKITQMREFFTNDLLLEESPEHTTFSQGTDEQISNGIKSLNESIKGEPYTKEMDIDSRVRKILPGKIEKAAQSEKADGTLSRAEDDPVKVAYNYLQRYFKKKLEDSPGMDKKYLTYEHVHMAEHWNYHEVRLSRNPAFLKYMREDPEGCIDHWEDIEKKSEELQREYIKESLDMVNNAGGRSRYVIGLKKDDVEQRSPKDVILADLRNTNAQVRNTKKNEYNRRLANLITNQIMADPGMKSESLRNRVARYSDQYYHFVQNLVYSAISDQNLLGPGMVDKTLKALESGTLLNDFREMVLKNEEVTYKEEITREKEQTTQVNNRFSWINAPDHEITEEEFNQFKQASGYMDFNVEAAFVDGAQRLTGVITYRDTKPNEEGVDVEVEEREEITDRELMEVGVKCDRTNTRASHFITWLMGKEHITFQEAFKIFQTVPGDYANLDEDARRIKEAEVNAADKKRAEYFRFVKKNSVSKYDPPQNENDRLMLKQSIENWATIFKDATEQLKKYKLPDINYSDINQVREKFDELNAISAVCINGYQDIVDTWRKTTGISGVVTARDFLGSEEFRKASDLWDAMKVALGTVPKLAIPNMNMPGSTLADVYPGVASYAVFKWQMEHALQPLRGLSAEDVAAYYEKGAKGSYQENLNTTMFSKIAADENMSIPVTSIAAYVLGTDRKTFSDRAQIEYNTLKAQYESFGTEAQLNQHDEFREQLRQGNLLTRMSALPDDAESMLGFYNGKIGEGDEFGESVAEGYNQFLTTKDWLEKEMYILFRDATRIVYNTAGLKFSDVLLIDGKPANSLFADKYKDVRVEGDMDEATRIKKTNDLKEDLYCLEVIKAIARGESDVSIRTLKVVGDSVVEEEPVMLCPNRNKLTQLLTDARGYMACKNDILTELNELKERLKNTQTNPEANFNPEVRTEGSESYRTMLSALLTCINKLESEEGSEIPRQDVIDSLNTLKQAADNYEREHGGKFFSRMPRSDEGIERRAVSVELGRMAPKYNDRLNLMRNKYSVNMVAKEKVLFKDASFNEVMFGVYRLENFSGINAAADQVYQRAYCNSVLNREKVDAFLFSPVPKNTTNYATARNFLEKYYSDVVAKGTATKDDLWDFDHIDEHLKTLSENPVFISMAEEDMENCLQHWMTYDREARRLNKEAKTALDNMKHKRKDFNAYIAGVEENAENNYSDAAVQAAFAETDINVKYQNLTEVVYQQILAENSLYTDCLRQKIAMNPELADTIKNAIKTDLTNKNVLAENQFRTAFKNAKNGTYRNQYKDFIRRNIEGMVFEPVKGTEIKNKPAMERSMSEILQAEGRTNAKKTGAATESAIIIDKNGAQGINTNIIPGQPANPKSNVILIGNMNLDDIRNMELMDGLEDELDPEEKKQDNPSLINQPKGINIIPNLEINTEINTDINTNINPNIENNNGGINLQENNNQPHENENENEEGNDGSEINDDNKTEKTLDESRHSDNRSNLSDDSDSDSDDSSDSDSENSEEEKKEEKEEEKKEEKEEEKKEEKEEEKEEEKIEEKEDNVPKNEPPVEEENKDNIPKNEEKVNEEEPPKQEEPPKEEENKDNIPKNEEKVNEEEPPKQEEPPKEEEKKDDVPNNEEKANEEEPPKEEEEKHEEPPKEEEKKENNPPLINEPPKVQVDPVAIDWKNKVLPTRDIITDVMKKRGYDDPTIDVAINLRADMNAINQRPVKIIKNNKVIDLPENQHHLLLKDSEKEYQNKAEDLLKRLLNQDRPEGDALEALKDELDRTVDEFDASHRYDEAFVPDFKKLGIKTEEPKNVIHEEPLNIINEPENKIIENNGESPFILSDFKPSEFDNSKGQNTINYDNMYKFSWKKTMPPVDDLVNAVKKKGWTLDGLEEAVRKEHEAFNAARNYEENGKYNMPGMHKVSYWADSANVPTAQRMSKIANMFSLMVHSSPVSTEQQQQVCDTLNNIGNYSKWPKDTKAEKWEFPRYNPGSKLENWMLFNGDPELLKQQKQRMEEANRQAEAKHQKPVYIAEDIKYLDFHIKTAEKIQKETKEAQERNSRELPSGGRLVVNSVPGGKRIEGTRLKDFQTSGNGCWSCALDILLQSRGVKNLTQEEIRAFRPVVSREESNIQGKASKINELQGDVSKNILEAAGICSRLVPDSMLKEVVLEDDISIADKDKPAYRKNAVDKAAEYIFKAIDQDKSPVALLKGGHYVTITEIKKSGNTYLVKYKDSMFSHSNSEGNPDIEITDTLDKLMMSYPESAISLTWMKDIKLVKSNSTAIDGVADKVTVKTDGTFMIPEAAQKATYDLRQKGGRMAKVDINFKGVKIQERSFLPEKVNYYLLKKNALQAEHKDMSSLKIMALVSSEKLMNMPKGYSDEKMDAVAKVVSDQKAQDITGTSKVSKADAKKKYETEFKTIYKSFGTKNNSTILATICKDYTGEQIMNMIRTKTFATCATKIEEDILKSQQPKQVVKPAGTGNLNPDANKVTNPKPGIGMSGPKK